jgi:hypothetical protein
MEYYAFPFVSAYPYHRKKQGICLLGTTIGRKGLSFILGVPAQGAFVGA